MTRAFPLRAGLLLLPGCLALAALPARADESLAPEVLVQTVDGKPVQGVLHELGESWSVRVGAGRGTRVPGREVLSIRARGVPLPPFPRQDHLILANGDRIPFRSVRLDGERLFFTHPCLAEGKEVSVPVAAVAVLWRLPPDRTTDADRLRRRLTTQARTRDTVLLRNGDQLAGVLEGLDARKVTMDVDGKEVGVPLPQVAAIALNTELADRLQPRGTCARVVLTGPEAGGGGRLLLSSASSKDGKTLVGTTAFGARLRVPMSAVAALDLQQERAPYLADLRPERYEHEPYLDDPWPQTQDGNGAGHDLLVGGQTYDRGISLHSQSRLTYRLAGRYRRFTALVGLDDRDGRQGRVRIRVLADGKSVLPDGDRELTHEQGPRSVDVSVEGARELTLEVQLGGGGNVQDVVNWVNARLIR